jgi:hypothetical protein
MMVAALIRRHPMPVYFALAFAISWGGVLLVIGPAGIPGTMEETETLFPIVFLAMLAGPSVAGILLIGLAQGRTGLRELLSRFLRWRVSAGWYAVALLTAPVSLTAVHLTLSLISSAVIPSVVTSQHKASVLLFGLAVGLAAGFFEELGWTGFAVPRMRLRYSLLVTGLTVGSLWGAWHFLVNVWASGTASGTLSPALFLSVVTFNLLAGALPAYRVLMVWVYDRTGSLLVAMLMHASLTASVLILRPQGISGLPLLTYELGQAAALWVVVAVVARVLTTTSRPLPRAAGGS